MALSIRTARAQIQLLKPLLASCSLETIRRGQNRMGELMEARFRRQVVVKEHPFEKFRTAWMIPRDERRQGVMLYLHGGGFVNGDLEYAKGFGSLLAVRFGVKVFCPAYRLAPEYPYPAALEDALEAYHYLLSKGYAPEHIALCGESAGGGLCYSLCLKLKELGQPLPGSIVAISPWTDLTASGPSYQENQQIDPHMTAQMLSFFAGCYGANPKDPLVSPLFADLEQMPPSLIFVGDEEIMRSDSELMHQALLAAGCKSQLVVAQQRWHGYLLYDFEEDKKDFALIGQFLNRYLCQEHKLRWMRLDNAAKIYPAARRQNWSNVFRISITLTEDVDKEVLRSALDVTMRRFPSIATRLRRGVFWYYLQQLSTAPPILEENSYPLARMSGEDLRRCAFRVIVYKKRLAVEFFHSITDGNGGLIFVKTLAAEYIQQKYGISIPAGEGVLGRLEEPSEEELEDSFPKYAAPVGVSRSGSTAWRLPGTPESGEFLHLTCMKMQTDQVLDTAHRYGVTLTEFLCAAMMQAIANMQQLHEPDIRRRLPVKVLVPVNLRRIFPSKSLRNFALYAIPEIDPRLGEFTFPEICAAVHHRLGLDVNAKYMGAMIEANVSNERMLAVKVMPLFLKNLVMKAVFNAVGECQSCLSMSNLGVIRFPEPMEPYVERMDFILGTQATKPHNCGLLSIHGKLYLNFIRNIREPELEMHFFRVLRDMGIAVEVESNRP